MSTVATSARARDVMAGKSCLAMDTAHSSTRMGRPFGTRPPRIHDPGQLKLTQPWLTFALRKSTDALLLYVFESW